MTGLLLLLWRRHRAALFMLAAGLGIFEWIITRLVPGPEQAALLRNMLTFLPAALRNTMGDELLATLTPSGFLGFAYIHPFVLVMLGAWTVRVSAAPLAGEVGQGTMDLLASRPVGRGAFVSAAVIALLLGLAVIVAAGFGGTALGLGSRPVEGVRPARLLPVVAGLWMLFAAFGGVGLLISALRRRGGNAIAWTSGVMAASFALEYLARAWAPIRDLKPLSLFSYYHPQRSLIRGLGGEDVAVLSAVLVVSLIGAYAAFRTRDL